MTNAEARFNTSTETRRLVRTDSPGRPPRLSHSSWTMSWLYYKGCFLFALFHYVSRFGLAVSRGTSVRICFGSPFSSQVVVCGHCLVTLSLTLNETLKWLSSLPTLMQKSFWWWQCSDRYIVFLFPHLHTPFRPFSPSLISLMVSVDVKHHVYFVLFIH